MFYSLVFSIMYLVLVTLGMCTAYIGLSFLFPFFFKNTITRLNSKFLYSIFYIISISFIIFFVSSIFLDDETANLVLHIFGGGFLSFFVCFRAARDSRVTINRFQFFVFSFLIVTALGVVNEIVEFIGQDYLHMIFAVGVSDTWLDLVNNWTGALIASVCFVPFLKSS